MTLSNGLQIFLSPLSTTIAPSLVSIILKVHAVHAVSALRNYKIVNGPAEISSKISKIMEEVSLHISTFFGILWHSWCFSP
jgi:hypothetical protein